MTKKNWTELADYESKDGKYIVLQSHAGGTLRLEVLDGSGILQYQRNYRGPGAEERLNKALKPVGLRFQEFYICDPVNERFDPFHHTCHEIYNVKQRNVEGLVVDLGNAFVRLKDLVRDGEHILEELGVVENLHTIIGQIQKHYYNEPTT